MSNTQFIRVTAALRDGVILDKRYRAILLCGTDDNNRLLSGEWMGYTENEGVRNPFVYTTDSHELLYGDSEHTRERVNIDQQNILPGSQFTIFGKEFDGRPFESTYEVLTVHRYDE